MRLFAVVPVLFLCGGLAKATPLYSVLDLGPAEGTGIYAGRVRINDAGQVAFTTSDRHAVRYTDGVGLEALTPGALSSAWDINSAGQVAGALLQSPNTAAFRYTDGVGVQALAALGSITQVAPLALNAAGEVVGTKDNRAFLYTDAQGVTFIGGAGTGATAINDAGLVAGGTGVSGPPFASFATHPFLYTPGVGVQTLAGLPGVPTDLNSYGQVVGGFSGGMFLGDLAGNWQSLGPFGSRGGPMGMNDRGEVVGGLEFYTDPPTRSGAFLYTPGTGLGFLDDVIDPALGWRLWEAQGINSAGQISGWGMLNGSNRAFRLTPVASAVPEPGSLALLAAGVIPLLRRRQPGKARK